MSKKTLDKIHIAGVIILVVTSLILACSSWFSFSLPSVLFWIIVAIDLLTLLVMEIVAVKRGKQRESERYPL